MAQTICRMYENRSRADAALADLREAGFQETWIFGDTVADQMTEEAHAAAMVRAGIPRADAAIYAMRIMRGAGLVGVRPPFGSALDATAILDKRGPIETGVTAPAEAFPAGTPRKWEGPTPFSNWMQWPTLSETRLPFESFFGWESLCRKMWWFSAWLGWPMLSEQATPLSTRLGMATLRHDPTPFSTRFNQPVLTDNATPLSTRLNLRLLRHDATPFSTRFNLRLLTSEPTPFSTRFGWKLLSDKKRST